MTKKLKKTVSVVIASVLLAGCGGGAGQSTSEPQSAAETPAVTETPAVPEGKGAIILVLAGDNPCIGTDENLLLLGRPTFNAIITRDVSFSMKDGAFVPAVRTKKIMNSEDTYEEFFNLCIDVYTVPEN